MNKPLTVAKQDFTESLVNLINGAELPAFVLRNVLAEIDTKLAELERQQYMNDKQAWDESLKEGEVVDGDSE